MHQERHLGPAGLLLPCDWFLLISVGRKAIDRVYRRPNRNLLAPKPHFRCTISAAVIRKTPLIRSTVSSRWVAGASAIRSTVPRRNICWFRTQ